MGQLRALQEELGKILSVGSEINESRFWKEGLPSRLQVYRNTVHGNAYDTLDSDYPLTMKQFSDDAWFDLSVAFFKSHPPAFWELNNCVTAFPAFLKKKKEKTYIAELADFELTDLQTFIHTATVKKGSGLSNPTAATRVYKHGILSWVIDEADPKIVPASQPEVILFYRNSNHEGRMRRADPLMLLLLDHFSNPHARLEEAEAIRANLLPKNTVPLQIVLDDLIESDLILL
jgi:hypothetical protein